MRSFFYVAAIHFSLPPPVITIPTFTTTPASDPCASWVAQSQGRTVTTTPIPTFTSAPLGMTLTATPPGNTTMDPKKKALIWGSLAGAAGIVAVGGTIAGVVATQNAADQAAPTQTVSTTALLNFLPSTIPPTNFKAKAAVDQDANAKSNSTSSSSGDSSSWASLDSNSSGSDGGSATIFLWLFGLLALTCCIAGLIAAICMLMKGNKRKKNRTKRGVAPEPVAEPEPAASETAPLLPSMAPPPVNDFAPAATSTPLTMAAPILAPTMAAPVIQTTTPTYVYQSQPTYVSATPAYTFSPAAIPVVDSTPYYTTGTSAPTVL